MKSVLNNILIIFFLLSCSKPDLNVFEGKGIYLDDLKGKWMVLTIGQIGVLLYKRNS